MPPPSPLSPTSTTEDITAAAFAAVGDVLTQAGKANLAADRGLREGLKRLIKQLLHQPPASPPDLAVPYIGAMAQLIAKQKDVRDTGASTCCIFLGAGVHFGPPEPPPAGRPPLVPEATTYPPTARPPVGNALAEKLDEECGFTQRFPWESSGDWQRVATWFEKAFGRGIEEDDIVGLEHKIREAVQTGKHPSGMVKRIASWPCRFFYTTNYDTHLEKELLVLHEKLWVWIYSPDSDVDLRGCWYEVTRDNPEPKPWVSSVDTSATGIPAQPPSDRPHVFKLHGDVNVPGSIVITDDDYITFMRRIADREQLPDRLLAPLKKSIIFVGYSLKDYNMRFVLSMLRETSRSNQGASYRSFSVDLRPDPIIKDVWQEEKRWLTFVEDNLWFVIPAVDEKVQQLLQAKQP